MSTDLALPKKRMFSKFTDIPLDKIDLDPENPRLVHIENKLTDREIENTSSMKRMEDDCIDK